MTQIPEAGISESAVAFFSAGGHSHDGVGSSLIDTKQYSVFDFSLGTVSSDSNRLSTQTRNIQSLKDFIIQLINQSVLEPGGINLKDNIINSKHIIANSITANELTANTITADKIASNTITADKIALNTITANNLNNTITLNAQVFRSNNYVANTTGWIINGNGAAEFMSIQIGGSSNGTSVGNVTIFGSNAQQLVQDITYANSAATNFNLNNDQNPNIPTDPNVVTTGAAVDHVLNVDGSADISFEWEYTASNVANSSNNIDGFIAIVRSEQGFSVTAVAPSTPAAGSVRYTTSVAHSYTNGDVVVVSGVSPSGYSGVFTITGIPNSTQFYVTNATTGVATLTQARVGKRWTLTGDSAEEMTYAVSSDKRAIIVPAVASDRYYTFGVKAYRMVDYNVSNTGFLYSNIVKASIDEENPYRPANSVAFSGDILGTIAGVAASNVANAATNFNSNNDRLADKPQSTANVAFGSQVFNLGASIDLPVSWTFVTSPASNANNIDGFALYLKSVPPANTVSVSSANYNGGFATIIYVTQTAHGLTTGDIVDIVDCSPVAYNKKNVSVTVQTATQFFLSLQSNPGTFVPGTGSVVRGIQISEANLDTGTQLVYLTAEKRSHVFTGLAPEESYKIAIRAFRVVDTDIYSAYSGQKNGSAIYGDLVDSSARAKTTPTIGGSTGAKIANGEIFIGNGFYNSANTGFYANSSGFFSLGTGLTWNNSTSTLAINGSGTFTGTVNAANGNITGTLAAGNTIIGSNISGLGINGLVLSNGSTNNSWFQRTSDGSVFFRAGTANTYISIDTSIVSNNVIIFPNFQAYGNGFVSVDGSLNATGVGNSKVSIANAQIVMTQGGSSNSSTTPRITFIAEPGNTVPSIIQSNTNPLQLVVGPQDSSVDYIWIKQSVGGFSGTYYSAAIAHRFISSPIFWEGKLKIGNWSNTSYQGLFFNSSNSSNANNYMIMSDSLNTFIGSGGSSGGVYIRPGLNDGASQLLVSGTGVEASKWMKASYFRGGGNVFGGITGGSGAVLLDDGGDHYIHFNWTGADLQFYVDSTNVKTFVINHPVDLNKYLVHACAEGATADVFYRGTGELTDGLCEIQLPSYFEDLTELNDRTVQITSIFEGTNGVANLAASAVINGKFTVRLGSGTMNKSQKFYWRVDAVRKNTGFNVEPNKSDVVVGGEGPYTYIRS